MASVRIERGLRAIGCDTDLTCGKLARKRVKDELKRLAVDIG